MDMLQARNAQRSLIKKLALGVSILVLAVGCETLPATTETNTVSAPVSLDQQLVNADDFITLFPGVWTDREAPLVEAYLAENAAIKARGPVNVDQLISGTLPSDTPGIGPVIYASRDWVEYTNGKYDWENPLRTDKSYAKAAGFQDIIAFPSFATNDDVFMVPYPPQARDTLLVSDLNHSITSHHPVYPGDTLYLVADSREMVDLTPSEGSKYRTVAIESRGSVYNQHGDLVNSVIFRVTESVKIYKEGRGPENPTFFDFWEAPDWLSRPEKFYSDADWQTIRDIWIQEERQGAEPLYWEDVNIGDNPTWTLDGPIQSSVAPVRPWGMGKGGSRTLKAEILNDEVRASLARNEQDGIYRPEDESVAVPIPPERPKQMVAPEGPAGGPPAGAIDTIDIHKDSIKRSPLINYMGREYAIRHIGNWMGDKGTLREIGWSIMDPRSHWALGKRVPVNPGAVRYLERIPSMSGKHVETHGLTKDVAIVKSEVVGKSVVEGEHQVELIWWIETLDGDIWQEGGAIVSLPTR